MPTSVPDHPNAFVPNPQDSEAAELTARILARYTSHDLQLQILDEDDHETLTLPRPIARMLQDILTQIAEGNAVTIMPLQAELTTQQAADLLNVSRPHLIKQLEGGRIAFHRVGTHRRIRLNDLLGYQRQLKDEQREALDALTAEAQELNLY